MAVSPVEQFKIVPWIPIKVGGVDVSFTNSAFFMVVAALIVGLILTLSVRRRAMVPGRWQSVAELMYEGTANMIRDAVGSEGRRYFPFIFTLFMFLLFGNLIGLVPYTFTFTSHIIVTVALALVVFIGVTIIGFARHGFGYLHLFLPEGTPIVAAPLLIVIEILSYFSRPFSLAMRLAINMLVGHVLLQLLASFVVALGVIGIVPIGFMGAIFLLELLVAILQAYVFTILSCIYLNDAIHMH
ncbi:MAG TPA: F0F1 ATP synthase subunit A [Magnetospirillaceae bacterium]|jgi:F-type H+-transporting ATPase subunit a